MRYNQTLDMIQIMMSSFHVLLQSCREVQRLVKLCNLVQENLSMLNHVHMERDQRVTQVLSNYIIPI